MSTPCLIAVRLKKSEKGTTNLAERFNGTFPNMTEIADPTSEKDKIYFTFSHTKVQENDKLSELARKTYENCSVDMGHKYVAMYCHHDGDTRLDTLNKCFPTYEKALQLVMLGACSYVEDDGVLPYMLAPSNVGSKDWETDNIPTAVNDIYDPKFLMCGVNYLYVFDDRREEGEKWKLKHA